MNTLDVLSTKVTTTHRAKLAYVYIRQSSLGQVTRNAESTDLQYKLVERAELTVNQVISKRMVKK